jgi:hypothetical protein
MVGQKGTGIMTLDLYSLHLTLDPGVLITLVNLAATMLLNRHKPPV